MRSYYRRSRNLQLEDRKKIYDYLQKGYSITEIALLLNRGKSTIYAEISRNTDGGSYTDYDPEEAQSFYVERRKHKKIRKLDVGRIMKNDCLDNSSYDKINNKIENLEFQIEIILDELKNIRDLI